MRVLTKNELITNRKGLYPELKKSLFLYPTDHGYSIGCDAKNDELVEKLRMIKKTSTQPLSIVAPSKEWIYENCEVSKFLKKQIEKIYGHDENREHAVTLILKLKNNSAVSNKINNGLDTIGVKILNHWMRDVIEDLEIPVVSTSANPLGGNFIYNVDDLNIKLKEKINIAVNEGETPALPTMILKH